jgi:translocation and assembly module TamA
MRPLLTLSALGVFLTTSQKAEAQEKLPPESPPPANPCTESDESPCETPAKRLSGSFAISAAYTPDEGAIVGAAVRNDRLFGSDHRLELSAVLSARRQRVGAIYEAPNLLDDGLGLTLEARDKTIAYENFSKKHTGASIRLDRRLPSGFGVSIGYRLDAASATLSSPSGQDEHTLHQEGIVAGLRVGVSFDRTFSRRHTFNSEVFAERSASWLGSDYEFLRSGGSVRYRRPLVGALTLELSGAVEALVGPWQNALPLAERLQYDGHVDVRGYGLGSIGGPVGSTLKATGTAELQFPLLPSFGLSGSLFYDAGIMRQSFDAQTAQSVGAGLLLDSPIGKIRLDVAMPLDDGMSPQLLLSIGDAF